MCSWQRRIAAEVSRSHTFVCVDWSWISSVQSHIFASTNGATVAKWDCVVDFLPVYYVVSLPRLSWTVFTTLCNTRHMCECIENSLSSITAPHRKGMLEGSSSEEADGLCRLLVHDHWIACIFFFFLSSSSFFFFFTTCFVSSFRDPTSSTCWSAWPRTLWRRCLTPSSPDTLPADTKRYLGIIFHPHQRSRLNFLPWSSQTQNELCFLSSGGDASGVEQARYRKLGSSVDHHSGHPGWFTASGSAHLRLIQGENSYVLFYRSEALYLFPFYFNFTKISRRNIWLLTPLYIYLIIFCDYLLADSD